MEEKQFLEILVKRYIANELSKTELEVFFHLTAQGKLDDILSAHLDEESELKLKDDAAHGSGRKILKMPAYSFRMAASVLLILGMVLFLAKPSLISFLKIGIVTAQTEKGQKMKVSLPDGSSVWLNESSRMEYPAEFNEKLRKVVLVEGEAYFDVKRDEKRPFHVDAAGTTTKVLGTAFNIRSYHFLEDVQVTVTRGKVSVEKAGHSDKPQGKIILPNEQVRFDTKTKKIEKIAVNSANAVAWKEGKLLFDNESFEHVTAILENKFGVKIYFEDESMKHYHMSAEFIATDSLAHILSLLSLANNLDYHLENKEITLLRKKRNNANQLPM